MGLVLVRIDDRLIHGQVVVGWARFLEAERIVVANDKLADDKFQKDLMIMVCPPDMEFLILRIDEVTSRIKRDEFTDKRTILLIANPRDALRIVDERVGISEINVGGMRFFDDRRQILPWVSVNEEEIGILRKLKDLGITLEARAVPTDHKIDLLKHIKEVESRE